jgi:hypothetical protein
MQLTGIDHIYITVSNFARAEGFYDALMSALGFRKGTMRSLTSLTAIITIVISRSRFFPLRVTDRTHDAYSPGRLRQSTRPLDAKGS